MKRREVLGSGLCYGLLCSHGCEFVSPTPKGDWVMRGLWIDEVDDSTLMVVEANGGPFIIPHTARGRRAGVA